MSEIIIYIKKLASGFSLEEDEAARAMQIISMGGATPAQISAYVMGLYQKKETSDEIVGSIKILLAKIWGDQNSRSFISDKIPEILSLRSMGNRCNEILNISLPVSLILSLYNIKIIDHGRYSMVNNSTAEILKSMGYAENKSFICDLEKTNYSFIYENSYLPKIFNELSYLHFELGIKSIFHIITPLCNPCYVSHQILGVPEERYAIIIAEAAVRLGYKKLWIIYNNDGIDKIILHNRSFILAVDNGKLNHFTIDPEDVGFDRSGFEKFLSIPVLDNKKLLTDVLCNSNINNDTSMYRDMIVLNASAFMYFYGLMPNYIEARRLIEDSIDSGELLEHLKKIIEISNIYSNIRV